MAKAHVNLDLTTEAYNPRRMQYHVTGVARCYTCPAHGRRSKKVITDFKIQADDDAKASELFQRSNRLCSDCLEDGTRSELRFVSERIIVHMMSF